MDGFLEDHLRLDAWNAYQELSFFFPMLFYGNFSDAGSIFGGLPSHTYGENVVLPRFKLPDPQELTLATSGDAVRHFHGILARDSVVEVRDAILKARHLVNAVDDASGNTALHVASQIEEPERRLEVLTLLLSEGAATLKRENRHGLSPIQLVPDPDTRYLLSEGIFAFYSRGILKMKSMADEREDSQRFLWCMITLMSREWATEIRIPADVRTGHWHSYLIDEQWLRQKQIRFSPNSAFAPAIVRSRGFLNALKTRLCLSHHDLLLAAQSCKLPRNKPNTMKARSQRYQEWEERLEARKARASETGEYEVYARYLLASTLDTEACEQKLIPSFVGLLYSLDFSPYDVLQQAFRLEKECTAAESELWDLYQRIRAAEKSWRSLDTTTESIMERRDVGMLRLFSNDADADLFFRREIFLLEFEQFSRTKGGKSKDGLYVLQEELSLEIDSLLIRTQRKLRKAEKKVKRVQDQIDTSEQAYRRALFITPRIVEGVVITRMALEHAHLRMAMSLIKHSEVKSVVARLEYAKQVLQRELSDSNIDISGKSHFEDRPQWAADLSYDERKSLLKTEQVKYSRIFQKRAILEEAARKNTNIPLKPDAKTREPPERLHQLQKEATSKLHSLFVLNLFRSCCCWLAENIVATEEVLSEEDSDSEVDADSNEGELSGEGSRTSERKSVGVARLLSAAGAILAEGMSRRRSSVKNTRRVLESYHLGCSTKNLVDPDNETMIATYAASAELLFEEERRVVQEAAFKKSNTKKVEAVAAISERNPITGELELPPNHVVSIDAISTLAPVDIEPVAKIKEIPRNRKKEELQRAMMHKKLKHKQRASSDSDDDDSADLHQDGLPVIHGSGFHFGTFVAGDDVWTKGENSRDKPPTRGPLSKDEESIPANIESMWKRGGIKLADGTAPSIKEVLAQAHRMSSSREKLKSGNCRQTVVTKDPPELPMAEVSISESEPVSSPPGNKLRSVLDPGNTSPVNVNKNVKRRSSIVGNCRPLGRAASMSCLLPGTTSIPTSPVLVTKSESEQHLTHPPERPENVQDSQGLTEVLAVPSIQLNTRSTYNTSTQVCSGHEPSNGDPDCQLGQLDETEVPERLELLHSNHAAEATHDEKPNTNKDGKVHYMPEVKNVENHEEELVSPLQQTPIVEISPSGAPELPGECQRCNRHIEQNADGGDSRLLQNDSLATSVSAFIKWEEAVALEAFPLAVVPNNYPRQDVADDTRSSPNWEKRTNVPRVGSIRITKPQSRHEEADDQAAARYILDESTDWAETLTDDVNEVFTLHGKSIPMKKKRKRGLQKSKSTEVPMILSKQVKGIQICSVSGAEGFGIDSSDSAHIVRPISVTVVTKPAKREVEVPKPVETPVIQSTSVVTPQMASPKPFVKFEPTEDIEKDQSSTSLELKVLGLSATVITNTSKQVKQKAPEQATSSLPNLLQTTPSCCTPARYNRKRVALEAPTMSSSELALQGVRLTVPKTASSEVKAVGKSGELTGFEGMIPLSKTARERLWKEFSAEPLSTSVRDAYTILYPQTYASPDYTDHQTQQDAQTVPTNSLASQKASCQTSSHLGLRVDSTRQPHQNAMELDMKFWSAVEGYRAIGSSSLVPLDAATIAQRRQEKAKVIYDQFFCGQGAKAGCSNYRGLALAWLDMYPKEVADVRRQLTTAPKGLFNELQRTAQLQISAALATQRADEVLS
ncbi:unnamed protein product [Phytophthora fragariaefolia]|uniref:Unnamed protein product n=1 Tax=Phytophthora fragariaefolia TaxID=1490495 RepID=A0A9W7CPD8_9STRA|nr:unnamed protein product [Phytophthora fragariaefolia]